MTLKDIANSRLHNQQLSASKLATAKDVVGWMGAMEVQHYAMPTWAKLYLPMKPNCKFLPGSYKKTSPFYHLFTIKYFHL